MNVTNWHLVLTMRDEAVFSMPKVMPVCIPIHLRASLHSPSRSVSFLLRTPPAIPIAMSTSREASVRQAFRSALLLASLASMAYPAARTNGCMVKSVARFLNSLTAAGYLRRRHKSRVYHQEQGRQLIDLAWSGLFLNVLSTYYVEPFELFRDLPADANKFVGSVSGIPWWRRVERILPGVRCRILGSRLFGPWIVDWPSFLGGVWLAVRCERRYWGAQPACLVCLPHSPAKLMALTRWHPESCQVHLPDL